MRSLQPILLFSILVHIGCGGSAGALNCAEGQVPCGDVCVPEGTCTNPSECTDGAEESCYTGPASTEGVGPCTAGTRFCTAGVWSECSDVTPIGEDCSNGVDDDCNGTVDDDVDADGDGFTSCTGNDCCDNIGVCSNPAQTGPGAFDVAGDNFDNDCDGTVDNAAVACDSALAVDSSDPMDYARAMELCQTAAESDPQWGVISASFTRASGSGNPDEDMRAIRPGFGTGVSALGGDSLVVLSTGNAAAPGDSSPSYVEFQPGRNHNEDSNPPADWLSANGGELPNAPGCPEPEEGQAFDPIMLNLRIKVPSNANAFVFRSNFYSSEYPEWVCSEFNDFFVTLLDSTFAGSPANPADKNLAVYAAPDTSLYPVGVNLAFGNTGLFSQCVNGATGCGGDEVVDGNTTTCQGTGDLAGTGFDRVDPPAFDEGPGGPGVCQAGDLLGGGTGWLETRGNVVPGEIIDLRIAVWDTGDPFYDSVVLLDQFEWLAEAVDPGTDIVQ